MAATENIGVRHTVRLDGELWLVESIEHSVVTLLCDGRYKALTLHELVRRRQPLDETEATANADEAWLASQPPAVIRKALDRLAHLNEAWTGYRSGSELRSAPGEPQDRYNPALHGSDARMRHKAEELGLGVQAVYRWQKRWHEQRLRGLVDTRHLKVKTTAAQRLDPRLREAIDDEMAATIDGSNITKLAFKHAVRWRLKQQFGDDVLERSDGIKEPARSTYDKALSQIGRRRGFWTGTAENRRSIASRPNRAYRGRKIDRPGQVVAIDSTPLDFLFWCPVSRQFIKFDLHGAFDLFDYQILARRLVPVGCVTAVDAGLLLHDMMMPKLVMPDWPPEAHWRYHGLPQALILDPGTGEAVQQTLSSIVPLVPNAVLVDRAGAYRAAS